MSDLDLLAQRQRASEQADLANQQGTAPVDGTVKLDPVRTTALNLALQHTDPGTEPGAVVNTAKAFEQYLRGDE